jgi:hypothetical protein
VPCAGDGEGAGTGAGAAPNSLALSEVAVELSSAVGGGGLGIVKRSACKGVRGNHRFCSAESCSTSTCSAGAGAGVGAALRVGLEVVVVAGLVEDKAMGVIEESCNG